MVNSDGSKQAHLSNDLPDFIREAVEVRAPVADSRCSLRVHFTDRQQYRAIRVDL